MGDQRFSAPLQGLIAGEVDISSIRAELIRPGILKNDLLSRFWNQCKEKAHAQA
jgi:hypothetical protein